MNAIENTADAFAAALAAGAEFIETDMHVSRDGVAVLWHDPDLRRFDGSSDRIADLDWSILSTRSVDGARLQTLAQALERFPSARFNVDLKVEAAVEPVVATVRDANAIDRVLLTSFSDARRRRAAELLPGVATSAGTAALARIVLSQLWRGRGECWLSSWRAAAAGAVAVQVPRRQYGVRIVTPAFIRAAHALGIEVHVWTINDPDEMRELFALGADGVVTDRCDLALDVVASLHR
ncbi:MAG: glycerophosphodiester phosphodiesterase family protein [Microbacteriaceae bacterium]